MELRLHHAEFKLVQYKLEVASSFGVYIKDDETGLNVVTVHNKPFNGNNEIAIEIARELAEYLASGVTIRQLFKKGSNEECSRS